MIYILSTFCCFLYIVWKCSYMVRKRKVSEPPLFAGWLPLVGHAYKFFGLNPVQILETFIRNVKKIDTKYNGVATIYAGFRKLYIVTDPDDILTVMNSCLDKQYFYKYTNIYFGNGLLVTDAATWKKNRKMLNPAFNQHILERFIDVFNCRSMLLTDKFAKEVGKTFNHEHLLRIASLETICINLFGVDVEEPVFDEILKQYHPLQAHIQKGVSKRMRTFWQYNDFIYSLTSDKKMVENDVKKLNLLSELIIKKKLNERQMLSKSKETKGKSKSFLDILLDASDELSEKQILDEVTTIIIAGHETVALTFTMLLAELGSHPEVQEKAYKEILDVLGTEKIISKECLSKLVYVEAIIKEVMRLYVISIYFPRTIVKDVQLKNYTLKAGTEAISFVYLLHRHSMWGPDADTFRPERWLDKETLPDPKYYGAFGLGKRNCIGKTYSMMSMKILLTHIIRRYRVVSDASKIVMKMYMLVMPHTGHEITLEFRNKENCTY